MNTKNHTKPKHPISQNANDNIKLMFEIRNKIMMNTKESRNKNSNENKDK